MQGANREPGPDAPEASEALDESRAPQRPPSRRAKLVRWLIVAAVVSLALVVAAVWWLAPLAVEAQSDPPPTATELVPMITSTVPAGAPAVLAGPGIDPTGETISTDGVRAFIAGLPAAGVRAVDVPSGSVIQLDGTIEIPGNTVVRGGGELRWTAGIEHAAALSIVGDNVEVSGLTLTNPNELGESDGDRNYGIEISGSDVRIIGNHVERFQNGIAVRSGGEYHDIVIADNRVKDVIGAGGGSQSREGIGEDRGDGIVVWGAQATITGNIVNAKPGTDARVGIHTENLTLANAADAPHTASMVTISANVVYGPFRRSIVSENVAHTTITGNTVADATWWSIALILEAHDNVVSGNTIRYTRTEDDDHGGNYDPQRAPIMVYGSVQRARITGNSLVVAPGASARAFVVVQGAGDRVPSGVTIDGNTGFTGGGTVEDGVLATGGSDGLRVTDNRLSGYAGSGVSLDGATGSFVDGNELIGADGSPD